ncbi:hypothetical protein ACFQ36_15265, partial [Arthrobacter sp. GCM10027362]|uniref:hypothetical protein n=1 Tax=Arthrobacter sp. GCM10027362 TaxID=3273379 RepID=UPI0036318C65
GRPDAGAASGPVVRHGSAARDGTDISGAGGRLAAQPGRQGEAVGWDPDEPDPPVVLPEPQLPVVHAPGANTPDGSPAFWERRYLRRWQTGLLR